MLNGWRDAGVETLKGYDRRAKAFRNHAGGFDAQPQLRAHCTPRPHGGCDHAGLFEKGQNMLSSLATSAQVLSVVVGVVITILSFNFTRQKEAEARQVESARPFLQLRQNLYTEAVKAAAILANPDTHTQEELAAAKKRFRELYVSELSMVEAPEVETKMVALAAQIDPELTKFTPAQDAAYALAHALRDSFVASWGVERRDAR
jgi:hypothetical protein